MIKLGAILPFSGGVELYGEQARLGLDLAVREVNAAGGILGRPLELVYRDTTTVSADLTAQHARELSEDEQVLALIGPFTSRNLNAMLPVCENLRVPHLYATNYEGGKTERYFFSFSTVPHQELEPLLAHMLEHHGDTFFLLGADRPWPHHMFEAAEPMLARQGGRVVGQEYTFGKEADFSPLIARVAASGARVLLYALKGDGAHFLPQARAQGLNAAVAYLGLSEIDSALFADGMVAAVPFLASEPSSQDFVGRFPAGTIVSNYVVTHYLTIVALKAALEKVGRVDREALVEGLEGLTFEGPTGRVTMGRNHHLSHQMYLARPHGRDLVKLRALGEIV